MSKKHIIVDPVTRIEGHLRIEAIIDEENKIVDAYSASTMFRGIETRITSYNVCYTKLLRMVFD